MGDINDMWKAKVYTLLVEADKDGIKNAEMRFSREDFFKKVDNVFLPINENEGNLPYLNFNDVMNIVEDKRKEKQIFWKGEIVFGNYHSTKINTFEK